MRISWTKELVIQKIKEVYAAGQPINNTAMIAYNERLVGAAVRLFGSYRNAVEAAGFDYDTVASEARKRPRNPPGSWSEGKIISMLKNRAGEGLPMNAHALAIDNPKLLAAATFYFGSYEKAIAAAGLDYREHKKTTDWTPETVVSEIKKAYNQGAALNDVTVCALSSSLYGAAYTHFGSWKKAVEAAGIDYAEVARTVKWSRQKVLDYIYKRKAAGKSIHIDKDNKQSTFKIAAIRQFGSVKAALDAAGLRVPRSIIKNRLRETRIGAGMSQKELGEKAGVSDVYIGMIELGKVQELRLGLALKIAAALNVKVDDIFYL